MGVPQTNPLTYNGYITQVATMAVIGTATTNGVVVGTDDFFNSIIPQMLNYAELRIQRDLDLLALLTSNSSYSTSVGNNTLTIPVSDFVTIQDVLVNGAPLTPVAKEWLQNVYGAGSTQGAPAYFAMIGGDAATAGNTSTLIQMGPVPDGTYTTTIYGTVRMPSLYQFANPAQAATGTTYISTWLPNLLVIASLIYISAYQRNFGRISDDPQMAVTYESQYEALLRGADVEEARRKFAASAWSSMSTSAPATPGR